MWSGKATVFTRGGAMKSGQNIFNIMVIINPNYNVFEQESYKLEFLLYKRHYPYDKAAPGWIPFCGAKGRLMETNRLKFHCNIFYLFSLHKLNQ